MLTYVSRFLSGELEPFWPHVTLLSLAVLASIAVGGGIIFERPKYPPSVHRVAFWLVVGGIAVEAVCTIFLFVFDEGISNAQQSTILAQNKEIIDLRKLTAVRDITLDDVKRTSAELAKYSGQPAKIVVFPVNFESNWIAGRLYEILLGAHWKVMPPESREGLPVLLGLRPFR